MKKRTLIVNPSVAKKILQNIPKNCSITIKVADANRILDYTPTKK